MQQRGWIMKGVWRKKDKAKTEDEYLKESFLGTIKGLVIVLAIVTAIIVVIPLFSILHEGIPGLDIIRRRGPGYYIPLITLFSLILVPIACIFDFQSLWFAKKRLQRVRHNQCVAAATLYDEIKERIELTTIRLSAIATVCGCFFICKELARELLTFLVFAYIIMKYEYYSLQVYIYVCREREK
jgi:hypothetical protein